MSLINFSGIASGIDTSALISALSDSTRKARVTPYEKQVEDLTATDDALTKLKEKFAALQTLLRDNFSTLAGGGLAKTATSTNDAYVSATASSAASPGTYSVTVNALAKNGSVAFSHGYSSTSALVGTAGTVQFTIGSGSNQETVDVDVGATTTVGQFVEKFNSESNLAHASAVNVGTTTSPDYRIVIGTDNTGLEKGQIAVNEGTVTELAGRTLTQATNADFNVNGITGIVRQTNSVSDVISGLTFNLTSPGSATITVGEDPSATQGKVQEFVDAFNDIVEFISDNDKILREEDGADVKNVFQPLASTSIDNAALRTLREVLSGTKSSSGSSVRIFADLGITTNRDGTLAFDTKKFNEAVVAEPGSAQGILNSFADRTSVTGGTIDNFVRFHGSFDLSISSNESLIDSLNKTILSAEDSITKQEDQLRTRFSRLEAVIGKMQSQQQALSGLLKSIG